MRGRPLGVETGKRGRLCITIAATALLVPLPRAGDITVTLHTGPDNTPLVVVQAPDACTNRFDILSCIDLTCGRWTLAAEGLAPVNGIVTWTGAAPETVVFYMAVVGDVTPATDPDGDGVPWGHEQFCHGTDPQRADTDGDGMPDGWEVQYNLNPLVNDANADPDGDGWNNLTEYQYGSSPLQGWAPDTADSLKLRIHTPQTGTP